MDLFQAAGTAEPLQIGEGAWYFPGFLAGDAARLVATTLEISRQAPFRIMKTPGGRLMSAELTGCGQYSWVSDARGYRYSATDPQTGRPWPEMPESFRDLAQQAARQAGYQEFDPDVCLINRYRPGARMGLHQDRDEAEYRWPVVSFSLGLPITFLWGGRTRKGSPLRLLLQHGDVVVWGGADRLRYHGVAPLEPGRHPLTGGYRFNLTFRRAC